jgi:hypothetical protein
MKAFHIPRHSHRYLFEAEITSWQFLFGVYGWRDGIAFAFGPFEISVVRSCDCC